MRASKRLFVLFPIVFAGFGCASAMDIRETVTPERALGPDVQKRMRVEAIEIEGSLTPLPIGATLQRDGIHTEGHLEHLSLPGDELLTNEEGVLIGVRSPGGSEVRFQPGTAQASADRVVGEAPENSAPVPLPDGAHAVLVGRFEPGEELPIGGSIEARRSTPLLVAGSIVFGLAYVPSVVVAAESRQSADRWLFLPVIGPWVDLAKRPTCAQPADIPSEIDFCKPEGAARVGIIAVGVVQGIGVLSLLFGAPGHSVYVDRAGREREGKLQLAPWALPGGGGGMLGGTF